MPVRVVAALQQTLTYGAVGHRRVIVGAADQMPGQRARRPGGIDLALFARPYHNTPAQARRQGWQGGWLGDGQVSSLFDRPFGV